MISANIKTDAKQQEIKELVAISFNVLLEVPSKLEIHCKTTGFEIRHESARLALSRTRQNHSTKLFSDSHQRVERLSSSNDNFHNNLILSNSNTLIFHFF